MQIEVLLKGAEGLITDGHTENNLMLNAKFKAAVDYLIFLIQSLQL